MLPLGTCVVKFLMLLLCCACLLSLTQTGAYTYRPPPSAAVGLGARHEAWRPAPGMSSTPKYRVRECNGGDDYSALIGSVDAWWGGRRVSRMLPRLFFENFCDTSFVVTTAAAADDRHKSLTQPARPEQRTATKEDKEEIIVGFLCGFVSQARSGEAHAHFIGIDPAHRGAGLGARLYEHFIRAVKARGCTLVHAVTSPVNTASVAFHRALGFETVRVASRGGRGEDGAGPGAGEDGSRAGALGDGAAAGGRGSVGGRAEKGAPVDTELVHVGYDGPDDGDRVVMEKRL